MREIFRIFNIKNVMGVNIKKKTAQLAKIAKEPKAP